MIASSSTSLVDQQLFGIGIEIVLQFEQDHPPAPAALDCGAEEPHKVFGLFLDLYVAVAQHAEHAITFDPEAGEQDIGVAARSDSRSQI